jgi:hypothetical protein
MTVYSEKSLFKGRVGVIRTRLEGIITWDEQHEQAQSGEHISFSAS